MTPHLTSPCLAPEGGWSARDGLESSRQKQPKIGTGAEGLSGEDLGPQRGGALTLTPTKLCRGVKPHPFCGRSPIPMAALLPVPSRVSEATRNQVSRRQGSDV